MKKVLIIVLVVCLIVGGIAVFLLHQSQTESEEPFEQYAQKKLDLSFEADNIEVCSFFSAIADLEMSLRIRVSETTPISPASLREKGWISSKVPAAFVDERLLDPYRIFDKELLLYNDQYDCLWYYVDEYYEYYGKKADYPPSYADSIYASPNYRLALYVPECRLIFYKEYDS